MDKVSETRRGYKTRRRRVGRGASFDLVAWYLSQPSPKPRPQQCIWCSRLGVKHCVLWRDFPRHLAQEHPEIAAEIPKPRRWEAPTAS
jgi:hypothetical protein